MVLLSRQVKRQPDLLVKVAVFVLLVRLIDLFWLIAPEFHQRGLGISWLDVVVPLALAALWGGCFIWQLRDRPILPLHDPEFDEALGAIIERGAAPGTALAMAHEEQVTTPRFTTSTATSTSARSSASARR